MAQEISIKRVYEKPDKGDGKRILVDRIWPRGMKKDDARIDVWIKDIAPSPELRRWYAHDPDKWKEFKKRYFEELNLNPDGINKLSEAMNTDKVMFVYSSRE